MGYRIAVMHDGFIPAYRERFFELLNKRSAHDYVIIHGDPPTGCGHISLDGPFAFPNIRARNREIRLGSRTIIYEPVVRHVLSGNYDAVVAGHEIKFVAAMLLFLLFKLSRKPALLWGHGFHRPDASPLARRTSHVLARMADGYLVYTSGGAVRLRQAGVANDRVTVVRNTIDIDEQVNCYEQLLSADLDTVKAELGLRWGAHALLFVGRLTRRKRVDQVIDLVRRLNDDLGKEVDLLIVGDGPLRAELESRAAGLSYVHFKGECTDVARFMRASVATVIPSAVGLAVNHSFAHCVPMITRSGLLHGPEIEYLRHGENGLVVEGDFDNFVAAVAEYLKDPAMQKRLSAGALAARETLGLDYTVRQFDLGVSSTIARRRPPARVSNPVRDRFPEQD